MPQPLAQPPFSAPMTSAAPDDADRLAAVHALELLDTAPDAAFDAVARAAAALLGAPAAYVGVLDADRLWLKASVGLEVGVAAFEAAPPVGELALVEDLAADASPAAAALLGLAPGLRSHAGIAVCDGQGHRIGSVGVLDTVPRRFDDEARRRLQDLAQLAGTAFAAHGRAVALARAAKADPLTGTADRQRFEEALDVELQYSMRTGEPFSVLCLAVNGFEDITVGFGHAVADDVLREVTRRLAQQVRIGDLFAHLGHAEFGIVMRHGAETEAAALAARIDAAMAEAVQLGAGEQLGVALSLGVAAYDDEVVSAAQLFRSAQRAQRQAAERAEQRVSIVGRLFESPALRLVSSRDDEPQG